MLGLLKANIEPQNVWKLCNKEINNSVLQTQAVFPELLKKERNISWSKSRYICRYVQVQTHTLYI